jgi:hypothetical protein
VYLISHPYTKKNKIERERGRERVQKSKRDKKKEREREEREMCAKKYAQRALKLATVFGTTLP